MISQAFSSAQFIYVLLEWSVHNNAIFDLEWVPHLPRIVTASGHQIACLLDVTTQQTIDSFKGHASSLKTIATRKTDSCKCHVESFIALRLQQF